MATEILPVATGAANSADIVVATGEAVTLCLKAAADAKVTVQLKDETGAYVPVGELIYGQGYSLEFRAKALVAPGTYRVSRPANAAACGVFRA